MTKKNTHKKTRGRPAKSFPYAEAARIVQSEGISSKREYERWWKFNLPTRIPKRPDCAYRNQNFKWSEFLGTNNPFPIKRIKFKSYEEAKKFAHKLNLNTRTDWLIYCRSGDKPFDIPTRPDMFYRRKDEWISWKDFLGRGVIQKHKLLAEQTRRIFYIVRLANRPGNVYKIGDTYDDISTITKLHTEKKLHIIKISYYKNNDFSWQEFIDMYGVQYKFGDDNEYVIYNIAQFISDIDVFLMNI